MRRFLSALLVTGMLTGLAAPALGESSCPFWCGTFKQGQLVVHVNHILAVAQQQYVLDGVALVYEVSVLTQSSTPIKLYYIEPVTQSSGFNAVKNVSNRAQELGKDAAKRITGNGLDLETSVMKKYPNTNTIEFRMASLAELNQVYESLLKSWKSGKGDDYKQSK